MTCTLCPLHCQESFTPRSICVPTRHIESTTDNDIALVYIGRNPGREEDVKNTCFIGPSGRLLTSVYIEGINATSLGDVFLTNMVRCHTLNDDKPPSVSFRTCATAYLLPELEHLSSRYSRIYLILLGAEVTTNFYKHFVPLEHRPHKAKSPSLKQAFSHNGISYRNWRIFSTYHPAYLVRGSPNGILAVHNHNQLILDDIRGTRPPLSPPRIVPLTSPPPRRTL